MAKVLVVDDEKNIVELAKLYLTKEGYDVISAADGAEALQKVKAQRPALVVLDIMLPRGNHEGPPAVGEDINTGEMGLEVLRQLREEMNDETLVIVLTAVMDDDIRAKILDYGVERYFTKPMSLTEFMDAVEKALSSVTPH